MRRNHTRKNSRQSLVVAAALIMLLSACGGGTSTTAADGNQGAARSSTENSEDAGTMEDESEVNEVAEEESPGNDSDDDGDTSEGASMPTGSAGSGPMKAVVAVVDTAFKAVEVTISAGGTVTWRQSGSQPHSVSANNGSFESSPNCSPIKADQCLGEGDAFSEGFDQPGTYNYYCRVHGLPDGTGMVGTVTVE